MTTVSATLRLHVSDYVRDLRSARNVTRSWARDLRSEMTMAGSLAGGAFGERIVRDASGRFMDSRGRFMSTATVMGSVSGAAAGRYFAREFVRHAGRGFNDLAQRVPAAPVLKWAGISGSVLAAGASLEAIPPTLSAIGGGLGAIPGLAFSAAASLGTLALGSRGIGGALGEIWAPPKSGGGGGGGVDRTAAGLRRLEQAQRGLTYAQRDAREAQQELNRAREQAVRSLRDMSLQLAGLRLDEQDALYGVADAEKELNDIRQRAALDPSQFGEEDIRRAEHAYERAQHTLKATRAQLDDLAIDQARAARAGVEGSQEVQQALRNQERALDGVTDAQYALLDAQEALRQASAGGGGAAQMATAYDKLSKNAKALVDAVRMSKKELDRLRLTAQNTLTAGLGKEFTETARIAIPFAERQIVRFSKTWNTTFTSLLRMGRDPQFLRGFDLAMQSGDRFFNKVNARIPATGTMLAQLFAGSVPFVDQFGDSLLRYVDDFEAWVDRAARSGDLDRFFADAADQASALLDIGRELFVLVGRIGASRQGSTLLRDMADALERFNDEAQGAQTVEGTLATMREAFRGVLNVLLILGEALGDTLADPGTRNAVEAFFNVLGVGAEVVATVVQAFGLLPDEVQTLILVGLALVPVWGRLQAMGAQLGLTAARTATALATMGPASARAGAALTTAAAAAGRAANAFFLLLAADAVFKSFDDATVDVAQLSAELNKLTAVCGTSAEVTRRFGGDVVGLESNLQRLQGAVMLSEGSANRFITGLYRNIPLLGPLADRVIEKTLGQSFLSAAEDLKVLDQALVESVRSGGVAYAEKQLAALAEQAGVSIDDLKKHLPEYAAAVESASRHTGYYAEQAKNAELRQKVLSSSMQDGIAAAGGLARALNLLNGEMLDGRAAESEYQAAVDALTGSIKENGAEVGGLTGLMTLQSAAARDVDAGMRRLWDATTGVADAVYESTKVKEGEAAAQRKVAELYARAREELIRQTTAVLGSRDAAEKYVDEIYRIPTQWTTSVRLETEGAAAGVGNFKRLLNSIPRDVWTNVHARQGFGPAQRWGGITERRWGGVKENREDRYVPAQAGALRDAMIASPVGVARYSWAEQATGGELFAPKFGNLAKTRREVGWAVENWWGGEVQWGPQGGRAGRFGQRARQVVDYGRPASASTVTAVIDYDRLGASVAAHLREPLADAARVSGSGTTVVQIDSVEVARATQSGQRAEARRG
ncbi:hypothetical protein [Polymorphospora rubra]|uniref:Uncharacterized protein n=1 Tax=Polymorphospora rubra TaxID=338584 RepID=A0A810MVC6_9ACTN|nr:hypothetical protein [Polymorphospora rubra]BCJ65127.1 hypothetical protein Prubr_21480 [Polymorphospora rubra]